MTDCDEEVREQLNNLRMQWVNFDAHYCAMAPYVQHQNYLLNASFVDHQWRQTLMMWNWKVYFNAGMFYGRVFNKLIYIRDDLDFDDDYK